MRSPRIAVVGGGPGGLFLARLCRLADESSTVIVHERNQPDDAFGFGVVFSDRTMSTFRAVDPETHRLIVESSVSWTDMELRQGGERLRYGGYGFTAISRRTLLAILQRQAVAAGARLRFGCDIVPGHSDMTADVVAIADGVSSCHRAAMADALRPTVRLGAAKYIWFGTTAPFDAVTFPFVRDDDGAFAAHAYPYGDGMSTFIVETDEHSWLGAGMDASTLAAQTPGVTDEYSRRYLTDLFADHLGGAELIGNNSKWANFRLVSNEKWWHGNTVLLGDAAHTAHFSVGSGTKLAMEDAVELSAALVASDDTSTAFTRYETRRRPSVARTQNAAAPSMRWWETFRRRMCMPAEQFGLHFITRTGAISYGGLRRRHAGRIDVAERPFVAETARHESVSALRAPLRLGQVSLPGRLATVIDGESQERDALATVCLATGSALALLDHTRTWRSPTSLVGLRQARRRGVVGVMLAERYDAIQLQYLLDSGVQVLAAPADGPITRLREAADTNAAVLASFDRLSAGQGGAWSADGDQRIEQCLALRARGADGFYLRSPCRGVRCWASLLEESERLRVETGLPVLVDGPQDWALDVRTESDVDDWPTRMHLAVVTGRTDLIAAWPLITPTTLFRPQSCSADEGQTDE